MSNGSSYIIILISRNHKEAKKLWTHLNLWGMKPVITFLEISSSLSYTIIGPVVRDRRRDGMDSKVTRVGPDHCPPATCPVSDLALAGLLQVLQGKDKDCKSQPLPHGAIDPRPFITRTSSSELLWDLPQVTPRLLEPFSSFSSPVQALKTQRWILGQPHPWGLTVHFPSFLSFSFHSFHLSSFLFHFSTTFSPCVIGSGWLITAKPGKNDSRRDMGRI